MAVQEQGVAAFSLQSTEWQGVTITESAAKRIKQLSQDGKVIQLSVKASGCTGYAYVLDLLASPADDALCFVNQNAQLYIPLAAMPFLDGTEVDYVRQGLNHTFVYHNPKAKALCGCGESFGV
ncbi:iron-sulfur cluster assembly accessory protein [Vibrio cholerae]|nr:iron-sulfur cluster assembly accessory protein [Vibrio cholerae]